MTDLLRVTVSRRNSRYGLSLDFLECGLKPDRLPNRRGERRGRCFASALFENFEWSDSR